MGGTRYACQSMGGMSLHLLGLFYRAWHGLRAVADLQRSSLLCIEQSNNSRWEATGALGAAFCSTFQGHVKPLRGQLAEGRLH